MKPETRNQEHRLAGIIEVARGLRPADLLLKNARVVDVLSADIFSADVAIYAGQIVGFDPLESEAVIDLGGRYLCPGFIDGHIHVESTMLTPPEFARAVSPLGTTSVMIDPHEIANVLGIEGINYMLRASEGLPVTLYLMLPSCVPTTAMETAGAELSSHDLAPLFSRERVLGLAEMMNYPGVLARDPEVLRKLDIVHGRPIDGHAPALSGRDLSAYIAAGIRSDHECVSAAEAREKLRKGMYIMVREGSTAKNLDELITIVTAENCRRFMLVTDDRHPEDILLEGHIDYLVRRAIAAGLPPIQAIQMATINPAERFGLAHLGAVAPGFQADLVVLDSLERVGVRQTFKAGRLVAETGAALPFAAAQPGGILRSTINIDNTSLERLAVPLAGAQMKVIGLVPDQIITKKLLLEPTVKDGLAVADPQRDIAKLAVVERHSASGNLGVGFVQGFGLARGALASSVAHDSHNVIVVGVSDEDMRLAVREIELMRGGLVAVAGGAILAALPLPIAGLISDKRAEQVAAATQAVVAASYGLGCRLPDPFITMSFLALPVIPALKLTDKGLVDVERFELVSLFD